MDCNEIRDLLPAYVIAALEGDEVEAVEQHLRGCRLHDDELAELRAVVFALDRVHEEHTPASSPRLRERVRRINEAGAPPERAATPAGGRRPLGPAAGWKTLAAAAVLVLAFAGGWLAGTAFDADEGQTYAYVLRGDQGELLAMRGTTDSDVVTVTMAGLEQLSPESSYQLWAIRDGEWHSIGICNTDEDGWWRGDFEFTVELGEEIALTIEPAPGSDAPTSEPLLRARF